MSEWVSVEKWIGIFTHSRTHIPTLVVSSSSSPQADCVHQWIRATRVRKQLAHGTRLNKTYTHTTHMYSTQSEIECSAAHAHVDKTAQPFRERHNMVSCMFISDKWISSRAQTLRKVYFVLFLFCLLLVVLRHTSIEPTNHQCIGYTTHMYPYEWVALMEQSKPPSPSPDPSRLSSIPI